ncbi:MAG: SMI1/KNR4 family protein [Ruminococcus sp.]|jgi:hypothetical protein|uniref:SMI1/KNR4 family protein n=1 Tax=Ruminococcus sp. TaxID=41978 RepID=UPI001B2F8066|nr:SMI1/KNR4 family protein [Ruminococcus sp.]MBO7475157.1 SMI1/KNR4 family protein [Ruminococcus sp.]
MWEKFRFNEPYIGDNVTEINGVKLPQSYIDFMLKHNGGEGDIGQTWLLLYRIEELKKINDEYGLSDILPNHIVIGSNGGEEFYGIDANGMFFNIPSLFDEQDVTVLCDDMEIFAEKVNDFWKNL